MNAGGLSKTRLGRLHDAMAGHVERGSVPGIVTGLSRRGEVHVDSCAWTSRWTTCCRSWPTGAS